MWDIVIIDGKPYLQNAQNPDESQELLPAQKSDEMIALINSTPGIQPLPSKDVDKKDGEGNPVLDAEGNPEKENKAQILIKAGQNDRTTFVG